MQLHHACSSVQPELHGFMKWTKPFTLRLHMEVKCGHVVRKPEREVIPLKAHMNHQQYRSVLALHALSDAARKALCVALLMYSTLLCIYTHGTSVTLLSRGAVPTHSRSSLLPRCQREDSPRLDLV